MRFELADALRQDVRFAFRGFLWDRSFSLTACTAIALAVGCATAVFSVVDRSLFRPLPYRAGDRLVSIGIVAPMISTQDWMFAGSYLQWQRQQTAFAAVTSWNGIADCDLVGQTPGGLQCARVEANFLATLGVSPHHGRDFTVEDDVPGADPVALISYEMWRSRFGGDTGIGARRLELDGASTQIIGVLPPGFEMPGLEPADMLIPQKLKHGSERQRLLRVIGRLHHGSTVEAATAALAPHFDAFLNRSPADFRRAVAMRFRVATLRDQQTRTSRLALLVLLAAVTAFVLIACANVANLLLARSSKRRQEFAIRAAMGASRWRLVRQTLTESGLLAIASGAAGCLLAFFLLRTFHLLAPQGMIRLQQASLDWRVFGFAALLSIATSLLFGSAPALDRLRGESLGGDRVAGLRRSWLRQILITAQLSFSLLLLTGSGLLLASFWKLQNASLGFDRERAISASFTLPRHRYADDLRQVNFFNALEDRISQIPGVTAAAITDTLPPGDDPRSRPFVALREPGGDSAAQGLSGIVKWRYVTRGYFDALGIRIRRGRGFTNEDRHSGEQPAIVSESLARRLFGENDPIGRRIPLEATALIVGVAADVRNSGVEQSGDPEFYFLRRSSPDPVYRNQRPPHGWRKAAVIIRTRMSESAAYEFLRAAFREADPSLAVTVEPLQTHVERFYARPRFQTALFAFLAFTGLSLCGIGLYGLVAFLVAERTREIGLRMALGATARDVVRLAISGAMAWTLAGTVIGSAGAVVLARAMRSLLYQTEPYDVRVFASAAIVLFAVALGAAWLPSRRASRMDPLEALRHE